MSWLSNAWHSAQVFGDGIGRGVLQTVGAVAGAVNTVVNTAGDIVDVVGLDGSIGHDSTFYRLPGVIESAQGAETILDSTYSALGTERPEIREGTWDQAFSIGGQITGGLITGGAAGLATKAAVAGTAYAMTTAQAMQLSGGALLAAESPILADAAVTLGGAGIAYASTWFENEEETIERLLHSSPVEAVDQISEVVVTNALDYLVVHDSVAGLVDPGEGDLSEAISVTSSYFSTIVGEMQEEGIFDGDDPQAIADEFRERALASTAELAEQGWSAPESTFLANATAELMEDYLMGEFGDSTAPEQDVTPEPVAAVHVEEQPAPPAEEFGFVLQ